LRYSFYDSVKYKEGQSQKVKDAWKRGVFDAQRSGFEIRKCIRKGCKNTFKVKTFDPKKFCSQSCAAIYRNYLRGPMSLGQKRKISFALAGKKYPDRQGRILVPRLNKKCQRCGKNFETTRWQNHQYCGTNCAIKDVGSRPTSPKAVRAISGIRPDIHPSMYFYSRWEANFARILNLLKIKWVFQPEAFDLKFQKYTPDFYLPEYDLYVEIKNFLSDYSARRDKAFRKLYPDKDLSLILKPKYTKLQSNFAEYIEEWEFS